MLTVLHSFADRKAMQIIMNRFLIVDGSNLLFQMFYGMPARIINKQGKAIQGTLGFVGALLKMIRMTEPTHVVVLFDGEHENTRSKLNADYKANRIDYSQIPKEETPFSQLSDVYAALDYLNIKYAQTNTCETDDWIAGYALTYSQETEIIISSLDSDFFQLISDKVSVLRYHGKNTIICTPDYIIEKFGIKPEQYADFKSMVGDASDNIKGAEKVGPKTAAYLLNEFETLDNVLSNAQSIEKPSVKDSIIRNSERLRTNYKIIKLDNKEQLPFNLNDLTYIFTDMTTTDALKGIGVY